MPPLDYAQFIDPPSSANPKGLGGIKAGSGITIAPDGTISTSGGGGGTITAVIAGAGLAGGGNSGSVTLDLEPPVGGSIGGVKAGSGISIDPDGTITIATGTFLPISGGTMTGNIVAASGDVTSPSIQFVGGGSLTGFYYREGTGSVSIAANGNAVMQWDDSDQCIVGDPNFIPAGQSSPFGGALQAWTYTGDTAGSGFVTVRASASDSPTSGDFKVKRCRGGNPFNPQPVSAQDTIGGLSAVGCNGTNWNSIVSGLLSWKCALSQNNTSQLSFYTDKGDALTEWIKIGPIGHLQPVVDNSVDLGSSNFRWGDLFVVNAPIVGADATEMLSTTPLDSALGLDFLNNLQPIQFTNVIEYNDVTGVCQNPTDPADDWVWENQVSPVAGITPHWGFTAQSVQLTLDNLGFTGNLGVVEGGDLGESLGIRYEELVAPLVLAVQQLSAQNLATQNQLDTLQTAFDNYVATHP